MIEQPSMKALNRAYEAMPGSFLDGLKNEVFHLLLAAQENANDSLEGEVSGEEVEDFEMRSLCSNLCDRSVSNDARAWFRAAGVKF